MNNVVFRRNTGGQETDLYLASFNLHRSTKTAVTSEFASLDPADMTLSRKVINKKTKCLTAAKDQEGHPLEVKLCPFCHGILPVYFHERDMRFVSVVGFTNSGKTTYLAALYKQLFSNRHVGIKQTIGDDYIPGYASALEKDVDSSAAATKTLLGPYIFNITVNDCSKLPEKVIYSDCDYVIYDIPGEAFRDEAWVRKNAGFIKRSDSVIFIVDPTALDGTRIVADCLFKVFGSGYAQNVAIIINKVDTIKGVDLDINAVSSNHNYEVCPPVDWDQIHFNDSLVERDIISHNQEIGYFVDGIKSVFSAEQGENVRIFATNLVTSKNKQRVFNPNGAEEPFFWLMSKSGLYPMVSKTGTLGGSHSKSITGSLKELFKRK